MEAFQKLIKQYPTRRYAANEIILHQAEIPDAAYVVRSGIVKAYNISASGDEKPISFELKLDILASAWVFGKADSNLFFYEAYTDTVVHMIPHDELIAAIEADKEILIYLMNRFIRSNAAKSLRLHALEYSKATDKVLHMLFYLCQAYGEDAPDGTCVIGLPLTQQSLANLLGLTRETTGMELLKLKKVGLITFSRQRYRVQKSKLLERIGDEEFESLELQPSDDEV